MRTILVSGASGIVGYGTLRSLRASGLDLQLVGTSIYGDSVAQGFCDQFVPAPPTKDPDYMAWLLATIRCHHVDLLIPGIEIDMYEWVKHLPEIEQQGARALINTPSLIALCRDKWLFFQRLDRAGLSCAITSSLSASYPFLRDRFGSPFLLKPRHGFGSKGIVRVSDEATFNDHKQDMGTTLMAQPIVGTDEEEYTTSAFGDGEGGFHACMTLRRKLSKDGYTEKAEVASSDDFLELLQGLCRLFAPQGPTNFQFRKSHDGLKLLEINPRISSSTSIRTAFGYNECAMAVEYVLDRKVPNQPMIRRGNAVRYIEDFITYENGVHL